MVSMKFQQCQKAKLESPHFFKVQSGKITVCKRYEPLNLNCQTTLIQHSYISLVCDVHGWRHIKNQKLALKISFNINFGIKLLRRPGTFFLFFYVKPENMIIGHFRNYLNQIKMDKQNQRDNTLRDTLQKFITLHKARLVGGWRLVQNACRN